jgi:hypothetical protein
LHQPSGETVPSLLGELGDHLDDELDACITDRVGRVVRQAGDKPKAWAVIRKTVICV